MTMQAGILSRMGSWFRHAGRSNGNRHGERYLGLNPRVDQAEGEPPERRSARSTTADALVPQGPKVHRRDLSIERLQEEYERVVGLVESIHEHLERQEERSGALVVAVDGLARSLRDLPETARAQVQSLSAIHERLEQEAQRSSRVDQELTRLPGIAEASRQSTERMATALDGFRGAVAKLGDSTCETTSALRQMHADAMAREERIVEFFRDHSRRFTWFAVGAICLAVAVCTVALLS
jgi:ABC-type transporter Mla subunit MlaD